MREGCEDRCRTSVSGEKVKRSGGGDRSDKKIVSKTLPLAEYLEAEEARYAGASPKLGIISLYNGH